MYDVNDHAPVFNQCPVEKAHRLRRRRRPCVFNVVRLPEDHPVGRAFATVGAHDGDWGENGRIHYSLLPLPPVDEDDDDEDQGLESFDFYTFFFVKKFLLIIILLHSIVPPFFKQVYLVGKKGKFKNGIKQFN